MQGPGGLFTRMVPSACGNRSSSSFKDCCQITLQAVSRPGALQQLAAGQAAGSESDVAAAAGHDAASDREGSNAGAAVSTEATATAVMMPASTDAFDQQQQQHQQHERHSRSSSSSFTEAAASAAAAAASGVANSCTEQVVSQSFTYMVSAVYEVLPGTAARVESALTNALAAAAGVAAGPGGAAATKATCLVAAVAVCTKSDCSASQEITPTGGELCTAGLSQLSCALRASRS
jgi:hypothetical protein